MSMVGDAAIDGKTQFQRKEWPVANNAGCKGGNEGGSFVSANADVHADSGFAEKLEAAAGMQGIGVDGANDDAGDARADDGVGAGGGCGRM